MAGTKAKWPKLGDLENRSFVICLIDYAMSAEQDCKDSLSVRRKTIRNEYMRLCRTRKLKKAEEAKVSVQMNGSRPNFRKRTPDL